MSVSVVILIGCEPLCWLMMLCIVVAACRVVRLTIWIDEAFVVGSHGKQIAFERSECGDHCWRAESMRYETEVCQMSLYVGLELHLWRLQTFHGILGERVFGQWGPIASQYLFQFVAQLQRRVDHLHTGLQYARVHVLFGHIVGQLGSREITFAYRVEIFGQMYSLGFKTTEKRKNVE